jgi:hypothetical protein
MGRRGAVCCSVHPLPCLIKVFVVLHSISRTIAGRARRLDTKGRLLPDPFRFINQSFCHSALYHMSCNQFSKTAPTENTSMCLTGIEPYPFAKTSLFLSETNLEKKKVAEETNCEACYMICDAVCWGHFKK